MKVCHHITTDAYDQREVIFVPGWGLETSLWTLVEAALMRISRTNLRCMIIELGSTMSLPEVKASRLVVGHSTGFLWLLQQRPFDWNGLIAVNGFTRFLSDVDFPQGVEADLLQRMLSRFQHDPATVITAFLRRCGVKGKTSVSLQKARILQKGLVWLRDWDVRQAFATESTPLLILAGGVDPIVPPAMTKACFNHRSDVKVFWQPQGGHLLPLSHPQWIAMHILQFLSQLRVKHE